MSGTATSSPPLDLNCTDRFPLGTYRAGDIFLYPHDASDLLNVCILLQVRWEYLDDIVVNDGIIYRPRMNQLIPVRDVEASVKLLVTVLSSDSGMLWRIKKCFSRREIDTSKFTDEYVDQHLRRSINLSHE